MPVWAKGDHEKAYKSWPVHPEGQPLLATPVWDKANQCFRVFVHLALPFGAVAKGAKLVSSTEVVAIRTTDE